MSKIAVIQIRGTIGLNKSVKDTLHLLRLYKKNSCSIINSNPSSIGMLEVLKHCATWGEIDKETLKLLLEKRGRLPGNKQLTEDYLKKAINLTFDQLADQIINGKKELKEVAGLKTFFRLKPPVNGFERQGIKKQFSMGGALGYRREGINKLIKRMV